MKLVSFLFGILFDEAMGFLNDKTFAAKRSIRRALKKIHSYLIFCFILTFVGTISFTAFVVKMGINLDDGVVWSPSLTLFLSISAISYGALFLLTNKKDIEDECFQYGEDSPDRLQDILQEILQQQNSPQRKIKPRVRRKKSR